ncbi:ABC transporter substrate-binding protein [Kaarinaea lacus]
MTKINIMALRHSAFYSPLLMTMAGGYLREEGLEPDYSVATPDKTVPDSLRNGNCHVAQSAVATSFAELEQGKTVDIVHFAQINARDGFFIAARKPDKDFAWEKLIGREVLVDHFFQPKAMLNFALDKHGISMNDLKVIDAGNVDEIEKAFRDGRGEYVHLQGPVPQQMEKEGVGYVVASVGSAFGPVAFSSLCATREWCESDLATAFMKAYKKSLDFVIHSDASEIAKQEKMAGFFPEIDEDVLASTIQSYKALGCWETDPEISVSAYETLLDVFLLSGDISRRYPYDSAITRPPSIK